MMIARWNKGVGSRRDVCAIRRGIIRLRDGDVGER